MTASALAIHNLLHRYAEAIDAGQLEQAAALFQHARIEKPVATARSIRQASSPCGAGC